MKDNEYYAKRFGWEAIPFSERGKVIGRAWLRPGGEKYDTEDCKIVCPKFATSLDAIAGEIKRHGPECDKFCIRWLYKYRKDAWNAEHCCEALDAYLVAVEK